MNTILTPLQSPCPPEERRPEQQDGPPIGVRTADQQTLARRLSSVGTGYLAAWLGSRRVRTTIYAIVAIEVALVVGFVAVYKPFDLNIYLWGGHAVLHGDRLYTVPADNNWFTYPPFAAALFTPLTYIPGIIIRLAWELGTVAAFAWSGAVSLKLAGYRPSRVVIAAIVAAGFLLEPVYHTLYLGQVNIFLMALVLWDVWRISQGKTAGFGVGLAAAIKLIPGIFIVLFLVTRRFKDAAISVATFIGCGLIGYLVDPSASHMYWTRLFFNTGRVSAVYISNQSPYAAATRILGGVGHVGSWYFLIPVAIGALGLVVAATLARHGDWLGAAATTGVTGLLVSPISWTHHWVWALPALIVLARGGPRSRIAAVCAYVVFVAAPMWFTPHWGGVPEFGFHWLVTLTANCFLIGGVAFLGYMTVAAFMPQRLPRASQLADLLGSLDYGRSAIQHKPASTRADLAR